MEQQRRSRRKLNLVAAATLALVALCTGVIVFGVMMGQSEDFLRRSLLSSLKVNIMIMKSEIARAVDKTKIVATRPFLVDQLRQLNRGPENAAAKLALNRGVQSFLATGFSGLAFFNHKNRKVATAGKFVARPLLVARLHLPGRPQLLWHQGFFLRMSVGVNHAGHALGTLRTEVPLLMLDRMFPSATRLGSTANLALCKPTRAGMECFPTTRNPHGITRSDGFFHGRKLPVVHAFAGQIGTLLAEDVRGMPVVAAYGPVGTLGLGMALKIDRTELFQPASRQWGYVSILTLGVLGLAFLILRWIFNPLVLKVTDSERQMREAAQRARDSENRVRTVLEYIDSGIITISETGVIGLFNRGAEEMFGYRHRDLAGKNVSLLIPEPFWKEPDGSLRMSPHGARRETLGFRRDGQPFPIDLRVSEVTVAHTRQFIGIMRDISDRQAAENRIRHMATHDTLTDLPNRALFQDRVQQALERAKRSGAIFAVLFMDLDRFKRINDSLGHTAGDTVLQVVSERLRACLRAEDTVSRQGGDEFTILLAHLATPADAGIVAAKILSAVSEPCVVGNQELRVAVSIGITIYPNDGRDVDTLMKNSDSAMYHAKETGRGTYCFFTGELNAAASERLMFESELRDAINQEQLVLHYQPIVQIGNGGIVSLEALVRWNRPGHGLTPPDQFISTAETSGMIIPLGQWVLKQVCRQIKLWDKRGLGFPRVAINISPRELRERDFVKHFVHTLGESGVSPNRIGLELTENVMMEDSNIPISILHDIKQLGVELSLDDFGTGYSNLGYLKRLSIDKLKVDRSFVRDIGTDSGNDAMVQAIMGIARHLQIAVVAEGVENAEQLAFLRAHGCDQYQGYYFSRPLPADQIDDITPLPRSPTTQAL
ncbi:MAG: putative bifunctional diguanylate cyclase/phosphodiesterase [Acidiferrobacteraceae bacterium]